MDAQSHVRRIWLALASLALRLRRCQTGQAGTTVVLVTLTGSSIILTAAFADGTFAFDGFEELYRASVARVSGSLEVRGSVVVTASGLRLQPDSLLLTLGSFGSGNAVSLREDAPAGERLVISYTDGATFSPSVPYTAREVAGDADGSLEPGEVVLITLRAADLAGDSGNMVLKANARWTLELLSPLGGTLEVSRTIAFRAAAGHATALISAITEVASGLS